VAVLVPGHVGVLCVVHAARPERDRVLAGDIEGVVARVLVGDQVLRLVVHVDEPEAVDVGLRPRNVVVGHDLLELVGCSIEDEAQRRREGRSALLEGDVGVVA
jgi:hypothetical protein